MYPDRSTGGWVACVRLGRRDGKPVVKRARAPTRDAALDELTRMSRLYLAGGEPALGTLDAYLSEWLAGHRSSIRPSTYRAYEAHVRLHISPLLGGITVAKLRPVDVRRLIAERQQAGISAGTIHNIVRTLGMALAQGVRERSLVDNATVGVSLPRVEREPVRALTEATAVAVIDACKDSYIADLVVLLLGSGLRVGEALGLDWRDVGEGFVTVRRSKTQVRAVPISDDAAAALERHRLTAKRYGPEVPVFLAPNRQRTGKTDRLRGDTVGHTLKLLLEQAGLPHMRVHDLRHGVATLMVARGVHMRLIAQQLGHANPAITAKVYSHVSPESSLEAVQVLNRKRSGT